jgi:predicted secreted protein
MNVKFKKSLKFITLLVTALLIATVSATIYNYMYIAGSGTITTTGLSWELGADAPGTASISGPTVTIPMTTNLGNPRNYTDCLHLINQDGTAHSFNITVTTSTGDAADFTEFNLVLFNAAGTQVAVLDLLTQGAATSDLSIGGSETWQILFELIPIASPTTGDEVDFSLTLVYT